MSPTEFYNPDTHKTDPDVMTAREVRQELKVARTRLLLASAFVDLLRFAYRSLQSHGIDYLKLPSYLDTELIDKADKLPLMAGADSYVTWIGRVRNDIKASIKRKGLRVLGAKKTPPPIDPPKGPLK